jgi:uncharacterized protein with von Willebrand factor type A (vWA) domain
MGEFTTAKAGGGSGVAVPSGLSGARRVLSCYTHDQQRIILHNLELLAATAQFIGQDFEMKVLLNEPGEGWHWNFQRNEVRVDPEDILSAPFEVSKAIYCHEGLHRRITPKDGVPANEWQEPGLPFLVNSIEDPRIENFGVEAYPAYRPLRDASYHHYIDEASAAAAQRLDRTPRHIQAGLEFIKQWFREAEGKPFELPATIDPAAKACLEKTLPHAQRAWFKYPTRDEVTKTPEKILLYFKAAYRIIREEIWPEYKKLYEQDRQDQLLDEAMRGLQQGQGKGKADGANGEGGGAAQAQPPLTEAEVRELLKAAKEGRVSIGEGSPGNARPLDLANLPAELQKEIADFVDALAQATKDRLSAQGDARLAEASAAAAACLEARANQEASPTPNATNSDFAGIDLAELRRHVTISPELSEKIRQEFQHIVNRDNGLYHNTVREISPTINELENDLRAIFQKRRQSHRESGRRSGPTLNINRFIRERAAGKAPVETKPFEVKTRPLQKDYAVLILVDVSGSMSGKIHHAFAATVACTEALARLKISHAILGFNDRLHRYKSFDADTEPAKLETIEQEVHTSAAKYNNDGWALTNAVDALRARPEREKLLIVLSDGEPAPSAQYNGPEFELKTVAQSIEEQGRVRLIGLGMGDGTGHVTKYYANSRANIPIVELPNVLSTVIKEGINQ